MPIATIAPGAVACAMLTRLSLVRNTGVANWKYTTRAIATIRTLASRRLRTASCTARSTRTARPDVDPASVDPASVDPASGTPGPSGDGSGPEPTGRSSV